MRPSALLLALLAACPAAVSAQQVELFHGVRAGMTPAETAAALAAVPGVRRAEADGERLRLSYAKGGVRVGDIPFEVRPLFVDGRLDQLWLFAGDRCSSRASASFGELASSLGARFTSIIDGSPTLTDAEVARLGAQSLAESKKQQVGTAATDGSAVAVVSAYLWVERPDIAPNYGAYNQRLWTPGQTIHRSRAQECNGNGFRRVDYEMGFMSRATYDRLQAEGAAAATP